MANAQSGMGALGDRRLRPRMVPNMAIAAAKRAHFKSIPSRSRDTDPHSGETSAQRLGLFGNAVPVRSWKPRKVWVARDGIFPRSPKCLNTFAPFESSLEALGHLHLSVDLRIKCYACQPHTLQYWMPDNQGGQNKYEYTPDFVALTKDGRLLIIDAKARRFATDEKWRMREPFIRDCYWEAFSAELIVWMEDELRAEPRLSNARILYRHRFEPKDKSAELEVRRLLVQHGKSTIGELCDKITRAADRTPSQVFGAIMRLALVGDISLEETTKYCRDTSVRLRSEDV